MRIFHTTVDKIKRIVVTLDVVRILLLVSVSFWGVILYFNPYLFADLENLYTDHMRHEYVSWLFVHVGFDVFRTPIGVLASQVPSLYPHPTWPMHPCIYPLGMIMYFLPFGILSNGGILPDVVIHKLMIFSFLIGAHLAVYFFGQEVKRQAHQFGLVLTTLIISLFYTHIVFWSLNGFYDVIAIVLIVLSIKYYNEGCILKSLVILTGSFFLHYRSIFYLPLWISLFVKLVSQYREEIWRRVTQLNTLSLSFLWFLSVASLDVYTVYLGFVDRTWEPPTEWQPSIINLYHGRVDAALLLLTLSALILFLLVKRKAYVTASILLGFLAYASLTPNWMAWHHLFLYPALLIPSTKASKMTASWVLIMAYLLSPIITPLWISHLLQQMFP